MDKQQEHGQYRKKPIVIEAWRIDMDSPMPRWVVLAFQVATIDWCPAGEGLYINTLEGHMRGSVGDWLIQGVAGELYACKPEIFAATYEPVPPTAITAEEAGREGDGWISVDDRKPEKFVEVLIAFRDTPLAATGQYTASDRDIWGWSFPAENDPDDTGPVTHWQPLPSAPAQSRGQGNG